MSETTAADMATLYRCTGLQPMKLMGRCANGSRRAQGRLVHIASGQCGPALCGQREGCTSAGWTRTNAEISCSRCLRRLPGELATVKARRNPIIAITRATEPPS